MTVKISEVWNYQGRSVELVRIETTPACARQDVLAWIATNRPELPLATRIHSHGFHAIAV